MNKSVISASRLRTGILLSIGIMFLMVSCNRPPLSPVENPSPSNTKQEKTSVFPLQTAIIGRWKCNSGAVLFEFYDNGDVLASGSSGKYTFMSQNNLKIDWNSAYKVFIRYDVFLADNQLTLSSIQETLSCERP